MSYHVVNNSDGTASVVNRVTGNTVISLGADDGITFTGTALDAMTREALAALGNSAATAAVLSKQVTAVTAADGTKAVSLPAAGTATGPYLVINTSTTATLPVYPVDGGNDNINGGAEDAAWTLGAGRAAWFIPTSATQWYVDPVSAATATAAELNYLDIATLGTGAASKAVVLDSGDDFTWPATGILTYGVLKDPAGSTLGATVAEINMAADSSANTLTITETKAVGVAESGMTFFINNATGFVSTLPAPAAGLRYTFINILANTSGNHTIVTTSSANIIKGQGVSSQATAFDTGTADDTINFVANSSVAGDRVDLISDGTNWYAYAQATLTASITFTQATT
jgi:hypothetical protein